MKWLGRRESSNVEDRRGMSTGGFIAGGGIGGLILYLLINFFGGDGSQVTQQFNGPPQRNEQGAANTAEEDNMAKFARVMLADNEDVWTKIFAENGRTYVDPKMVLFSNYTESACGSADAATGPFYCPSDQKVYLDL